MELVHINFLKAPNYPTLSIEAKKVKTPKYCEFKELSPVTIDDEFNIEDSSDNINLLLYYIKSGVDLLPVRRKTSGHLIKSNPLFPSRVLLELTSQCNLDCVMCPRTVLDRTITSMPKEIAKRCIDELDNQKIQALWLYNIGESLLHPNFKEILDYCSTKKTLGQFG